MSLSVQSQNIAVVFCIRSLKWQQSPSLFQFRKFWLLEAYYLAIELQHTEHNYSNQPILSRLKAESTWIEQEPRLLAESE